MLQIQETHQFSAWTEKVSDWIARDWINLSGYWYHKYHLPSTFTKLILPRNLLIPKGKMGKPVRIGVKWRVYPVWGRGG